MNQKTKVNLNDFPALAANPFPMECKWYSTGMPSIRPIHFLEHELEVQRIGNHVQIIKTAILHPDEFIKVGAEIIATKAGMSSAAKKVYVLLLGSMRSNPLKDGMVCLSWTEGSSNKINMSRSTFIRGKIDLLNVGIIARSEDVKHYFVNGRFILNQSRLVCREIFQDKSSDESFENMDVYIRGEFAN